MVCAMPHTLALHIVLASATGVLHPLLFPYFDFGFLAWIFLIPLHAALTQCEMRRAFWVGWLSGLIAFVGAMHWVVTAMSLYGKMPLVLSYAAMLLLSLYLGLFFAIYALLFVWLRNRLTSLIVLAAPCIWVTLELLRTYLFSGLPWTLLGYSQYRWLPAIQIADLAGVYGVSFVLVLVNVALTEAGLWAVARWRGREAGSSPWVPVGAALLVVLFTMGYGYGRLASLRGDAAGSIAGMDRSLRIGLVQANIDQAQKWNPAFARDTIARYQQLTDWAAEETDLVIWPEAATPFLFERELDYRAIVTDLVQAQSTPLLFGSPAVGYEVDGRPYLLNSAYLLSTQGHIIGRYDKQHLVPFGEYVPLRTILFFLDKLVEGIGDFKAGTQPTILHLPQQPPDEPITFGVVICYEVIFPDLVRQFAARGVDFMATITNDAWFGRSVAPFQHFGMVVLRAVENRVAFARAANTGISGFIDPTGRIVTASPIFEQVALKGVLPIGRISTFYTRFGDVFAYGCVIIAGLLCALAFRQGRQYARGTGPEVA